DVGVEPGRMIGRVDREHRDEGRESEERSLVLAQPIAGVAAHVGTSAEAPWLRAASPRLSALLTSACSVIASPESSRRIAPSTITSTRSQQPTSSSTSVE